MWECRVKIKLVWISGSRHEEFSGTKTSTEIVSVVEVSVVFPISVDVSVSAEPLTPTITGIALTPANICTDTPTAREDDRE